MNGLITMEVGAIYRFRSTTSPTEDFRQVEAHSAPATNELQDNAKHWGNNKYKVPLSLKKTRARIANKSKRRNRK